MTQIEKIKKNKEQLIIKNMAKKSVAIKIVLRRNREEVVNGRKTS